MNAIEKLVNYKDAFKHGPESDGMFLEAMRENFTHHFTRNPTYRTICLNAGFTPENLQRYNDIFSIPQMLVSIFKTYTLLSLPEASIKITLTSSGTGGKTSANYLDRDSLSRIKRIVHNIYHAFGMRDKTQKVNYLCFTYDPYHAKTLGTAFSDKLLSSLTAVHKIFYAIQWDKSRNDFSLNQEKCWETLESYSRESLPLRILGFPSFAYEVLGEYHRRWKRNFKFGSDSWVIIGGGWKTLQDKEIPKEQFRRDLGRWLGIPPSNVRDLFGMVEHGVPYCECQAGHMHVPVYSRVGVRHPATLALLPYGQTGLLHFFTPYLQSLPALSLLTTDLGSLNSGCACGRNAPYIEIAGRGGVKKYKGCAISALEILKQAT